jgi:hypothetical protein
MRFFPLLPLPICPLYTSPSFQETCVPTMLTVAAFHHSNHATHVFAAHCRCADTQRTLVRPSAHCVPTARAGARTWWCTTPALYCIPTCALPPGTVHTNASAARCCCAGPVPTGQPPPPVRSSPCRRITMCSGCSQGYALQYVPQGCTGGTHYNVHPSRQLPIIPGICGMEVPLFVLVVSPLKP